MVNRMSSGRLEGKRVFSTGAGGGLVAAIARAFAAEGAVQVLAGRTLERVEAVASGLDRADAVQLDVADSAAVEAAVAAARSEERRVGKECRCRWSRWP